MKRHNLNEYFLLAVAAFMFAVFMGNTACAQSSGVQADGKLAVGKAVNINSASVKELSSLPGIGKKRAEAIIAYRTANGKLGGLEDLNKVEGMGKKIIEKIEDQIVFE